MNVILALTISITALLTFSDARKKKHHHPQQSTVAPQSYISGARDIGYIVGSK